MINGFIFLTAICVAAGFNIFTKPEKHFEKKNENLFGQTIIQSKHGILAPSPQSATQNLYHCTKERCTKVNIEANVIKGLKPVVSAAKSLDGQKHMVCQQVRKRKAINEDLNGLCTVLRELQRESDIDPASLVVEQMKKNVTSNSNHNNNNNNNGSKDSPKEEPITPDSDAGTEIAFVLDGSGSIEPEDFERAKSFMSNMMKNVWKTCFNCDFAIVQYGEDIRTELSLMENDDAAKVLEKVKNIQQIGSFTKTASAINHVLEHVFVPEYGSKEISKKIIIVMTDGRILFDPMDLTDVLNFPKMKDILRFAVGIGDVISDIRGVTELKEIASDPDDEHLFLVNSYTALDSILLQMTKRLTGIEDQSLLQQRGQSIENYNKNNNNNNKDDNADEDDEDAGTEIAFVLDGSGSIDAKDFERAKQFMSTVMRNVWNACLSCDFAIVQYGEDIRTELSLKENDNAPKALEKVKNIQQIGSFTKTASAINHVLEHVFVAENGSKENSKKLVIVITDGRILFDPLNLTDVLNLPKMKNILRFAIGVGDVLNDTKGIAELEEIASDPDDKHLFMVNNYAALDSILSLMERTITGIEGIQQGAAFIFELAEAGFSIDFAHDGTLLFGAVGAYDWSGGLILKHPGDGGITFLNDSSAEPRFSYLGYSVVSVKGSQGSLFVSGAPRYNLTGAILVFNSSSHKLIQRLPGDQVGSYFGSELCALDTDMDEDTDHLLVGAPFFHRRGEEGRVYVYKLDKGQFRKEKFELWGVEEHTFARFGSAIASIGDIDGDRFSDVAVGAPLEGEERAVSSGCVYIYNGYEGGIRPRFSQRISAADLKLKLRYFGRAVSRMLDPGDNRKQTTEFISVGSEGGITVLRTLPVIVFKPKMNLDPKVLPQFHNLGGNTFNKPINLKICFEAMRGHIDSGQLPISYEVNLDVSQMTKRLSFGNSESKKDTFNFSPDRDCLSLISLKFMGCYDCFSPIEIRLKFTLPHDPSAGAPVRVLDQFSPTEHTVMLPFQRDCDSCIADISLSDSGLSKDMIVVGRTEDLNITFNLTNKGDISYMTTLLLTYPSILNFNVVSKKAENIACKNEGGDMDSRIKCNISHPVLRKHAQTIFSISWSLSTKKPETRTPSMRAVLTCENNGTQVLDNRTYSFAVKSALNVQILGKAIPPLLSVISGEENVEKDLQFEFEVHGENKYNATITVTINITVKGRSKLNINKVSSRQGRNECSKQKTDNSYFCHVNALSDTVHVEAKVVIKDSEVAAEKILASATLSYDQDQFEAMGKKDHHDEVEVHFVRQEVVKSTATIIGGSIGGFLLLAIIIAILVKCGFFKSRYSEIHAEN
ncbi:integrin alpha-E [Megalops cyprinoides]|uniref:integrin alpha-E n=1 Tax=Megalops cyprinoides TaxID=118141 RepID=UPI0018640B18|nr:integrin alpha-E [Megalops cyprinoides]